MASTLWQTSGLIPDKHGIYRAKLAEDISYPDSGNKACFQLEDSSFWFRHRNKCIIELFKRFPPDGIVLDIGGGNGFVTRGLIDAGIQAALLEPGPDGAMNAKIKRQIPDVICSSFEDANFDDGSVPNMGLFDVIEHIADDSAFIEQVHRILKPDGLLFITVPSHEWLWSSSDNVAGHYRRYNKHTLTQLLGDHFDILYLTHLFRPLTLPIFFTLSVPSRLGLARKKTASSTRAEHGVNRGLLTRTVEHFLKGEVQKIRAGKFIPFGTSCLLAARKKSLT